MKKSKQSAILSSSATKDLYDIWKYTSKTWSSAQAEIYTNKIRTACNKIGAYPAIGRRFEDVSEQYLGYMVGMHVVFYTVVAPGEVLIVRILHASMDFKNRIIEKP